MYPILFLEVRNNILETKVNCIGDLSFGLIIKNQNVNILELIKKSSSLD